MGQKVFERVPKRAASDGKPYEVGDARRYLEPTEHTGFGCVSTEHDASHVVATVPLCALRYGDAVLTPIEPFDFPDIRLDPAILKLAHGRTASAGRISMS